MFSLLLLSFNEPLLYPTLMLCSVATLLSGDYLVLFSNGFVSMMFPINPEPKRDIVGGLESVIIIVLLCLYIVFTISVKAFFTFLLVFADTSI